MKSFKLHRNRKVAGARRDAIRTLGTSCRLRLELLEDRVMLSATALDLTQGVQSVRLTPISGNQPAQVSNPIYGGFINVAVTDSTANGISRGNFGSVSGAVSDFELHYLVNRTLINAAGNGIVQVLGGGIRPAVIIPDVDTGSSSLGGSPRGQTAIVENRGGAIAIAPILANVGTLYGPAGPAQLAQHSATADSVVAKSAQATARPSQETAVAAEWARAIVFELVDDQSADSRSATKKTDAKNEPGRRSQSPLSDAGSHSEQASNRMAATNQQFDEASATSASGSGAPGDSAASSTASVTPAPLPVGDVSAVSTVAVADAAHQEAFEQFGDGEKSHARWLTLYSKPVLGASPLLMVLALERIAARNSRRMSLAGSQQNQHVCGA